MTAENASSGETASLNQIEPIIKTQPDVAAQQLRDVLTQYPLSAHAYRLLARALDEVEQRSNRRGEVRTTVRGGESTLEQAARALTANDLQVAEIILRKALSDRPTDVDALSLMARLADELNFERESEDLLRLAIELAPDFSLVRIELARLLDSRHRPLEARKELETVLAQEPDNLFAKAVLAAALGRSGQYAESVQLYEDILRAAPAEPALWTTYGNVLKTMGRADDGLRAMRKATSLAPHSGMAWWNLANLKTARFDAADIAAMRAALDRRGLGGFDRFHINFALGKAYEDAGDAAEAFARYDQANTVCRQSTPYHADALTAEVDAAVELFSRRFFDEREGSGAVARDPIFVVGMPRAGSTLIEQILASHPAVEGTKELAELPIIAKELGQGSADYWRDIAALPHDQFRLFGEKYIEQTRRHRLTDRPLFVDKMPTNWRHVPLIQLLLPNARIIDARRHPLACGFSNFKQLYAKGHAFSYDLADIGGYYREYVRLMAHIDVVLPGRVHRVFHERLIDDTEGEIRRMLDYLDLPFDPACVKFHETDRAVRTPSAEQVRQPISRSGVDHWRMFEPWLEPLKAALGPVLDCYPDVPDFSAK